MAKNDITKAVSEGRVSLNDIDFLYKLANGSDPTGSGLDNEGLIELTRKKGTELFGARAGRFFWNGHMEVWDHMLSEYKRQIVNKPKKRSRRQT
ncbi:MAG: hypothetical protein M1120_02270 [Patescibacteria group bacterium]|nr:hypothetical protein [Patescibacteria group bacterium]